MSSTGTPPPPAAGHGLTSPQVAESRSQSGYNEIPEKRRNPVTQFLRYLWGPIPWMIEAAAALAFAGARWEDFGIVLALLLVNAVVGFWEERQAGNAVSALKARLAVQARVERDGAWSVVPARELVPGDWIRLRPGDVVPADVVLGSAGELEVDQSALTGESLSVERHRGDTVYSSSIVARGEMEGAVHATGRGTFFGRTAELVQTAHTVSHFQRAVLRIGNFLVVVALSLAIVIEAVALLRGGSLLSTLQFALILTIAAIPVAMPTVLSVTMAVGARKMAREQAIVTRLSAMEELAGMDILCSDKTGTLTENRMTMGTPFVLPGVAPSALLVSAGLASRAENRDPIDLAILAQVAPGELAGYEVVDYEPFDPTTKRTRATVREAGGGTFQVAKGACQVVFDLAQVAGDARRAAEAAVAEFAAKGYRTLGVARAGADGVWRLLGILPLFDPLRPDAREVIGRARSMGVGVKILTGDQLAIGRETARRLGLGANFLSATALHPAAGGAPAPTPDLEAVDGFAQVFPEDKFAIVDRLQREGHIVGMTGDGVNDAPALKKADAGVAVSGATDVARGAASVVLLSAGLGVLVDAIAESRRIFARMTSYAIYRVGETIRILLFLSLSILAYALYPVTAVMIVLIAVLNDGAILTIAYDRARVAEAPVRWEMSLVLLIALLLGVVGVAFSFLLFYLALRVWALPYAAVQTLVYLKLSVAGPFGIYATRTRGAFWSSRPAGLLLAAIFGAQATATLLAVTGVLLSPLPLVWVAVVWAFAAMDLVAFDSVKRLTYHLRERRAGRRGAGPRARGPEGPVRTHFFHPRFGAPSRPSSGPVPTSGSATVSGVD